MDKQDIYQRITQQVVEAIETGATAGGYKMPWNATAFRHRSVAGRPYRGANALLLSISAAASGYGSGVWGTVRAWNAAGGRVRQGERGSPVVVWKTTQHMPPWEEQEGDEGDGQRPSRARFFARGYTVFAMEQVEGIDPETVAPGPRPISEALPPDTRLLDALAAMGVPVQWSGPRAYYVPALDRIQMPDLRAFTTPTGPSSVLAHEAAHATGHASRLARDLSKRFGSEGYAVEEMIAELAAAMVLGAHGYAVDPRQDHAPYIESWLRVLKADAKAIITIASKAQAAADFLLEAAGVRLKDTPAAHPEEAPA